MPVTVHVGIGYDITHEQPNADGAVIGAASYRDFLVFAETVTKLQGGVMLNFGTAVMGPEVYLKALAMARNVARQRADASTNSLRLYSICKTWALTCSTKHRKKTRRTIFVRSKRFSFARWQMAARVSTSVDITGPLCRICIAW